MKQTKIKAGRNAVSDKLVKKVKFDMITYLPDDKEVVEKVDSKLTADEKRRRDNPKQAPAPTPKRSPK